MKFPKLNMPTTEHSRSNEITEIEKHKVIPKIEIIEEGFATKNYIL